MKKNVDGQTIGAQMITAADGSDFTSNVGVYVTIDNGAQTGVALEAVSKGNGYYSLAVPQAQTNGDHIAFTFTGNGAISSTVQVYTTFPQTGDSYPAVSTNLDASVSTRMATTHINATAGVVDTVTTVTDTTTQAATALSNIGLDHLISAPVTGTDVTDNSIIAYLVSSAATASWDTYMHTNNSLEAIGILIENPSSAELVQVTATQTWDILTQAAGGPGTFGEVVVSTNTEILGPSGLEPIKTVVDAIPARDAAESYRQIRDGAGTIQQEIRETITSTEQNP